MPLIRIRLFFLIALTLITFSSASYASFEVQVAEAPTNDLALTLTAIQSAKRSLLLNIYELTQPAIANAILARINEGLRVQMLVEGQPVGGIDKMEQTILSQLVKAMRKAKRGDHLYEMRAPHLNDRRFRFDHAKYVVIDGTSLLIGSENYSPTGNPTPGSIGNRGWEVLIQDAKAAESFATIFASDSNTSHGDVSDLLAVSVNTEQSLSTIPPGSASAEGAGPVLSAASLQVMTSPNSSLKGLESMISSAKNTIDVELMTFDSTWKGAEHSPLIDDLLAAARRGVTVRILLDDESAFGDAISGCGRSVVKNPKNKPTADLLNQSAKAEHLPLTARIANIKAMGVDYIHNKGVLVDQSTLISSINWDQNSITNNREAAVLIESPSIHDHYEALFSSDWNVSALQN